MPTPTGLIAFALIALTLVCAPGPNMIYLVSRSICQGPKAGLISLGGVGVGFIIYMLLAAFGLTAMIIAVPFAYDALRFTGAAYLFYLAWRVIRPGDHSPFQVKDLPSDRPRRLFMMGLLTNLLNPKAAVLDLLLLPQFIRPERGHVLLQLIALGSTQIAISMTVNAAIILTAGGVARFLETRRTWATLQRYVMATVLGGLAVRVATEARR